MASAAQLAGLAGLMVATGLAPSAVARHATIILAVGLGLGGIHGTADHLVGGWIGGRPGGRVAGRRLPATAAGRDLLYAAVATGSLLALLVAGPTVLWVLIALSVVHFATGESVALALRGRRSVDRLDRAAGWAAAIAMVVVPLLGHPGPSGRIATAVIDRALPMPGPLAREVAVVAACLAAVAVAVASFRRDRRLGALEVLAVMAAGLLTPPAAAFGVTFALGHSVRHVVRLAGLRGRVAPSVPTGRGAREIFRSSMVALWPVAVAAAAASLAVVTGAARWQTAVLGGMLALTVPHAAVVAALDRADSAGRRVDETAATTFKPRI